MSSRDRSLLAVIVLLLVAVGGYFIIVAPEHHKADRLSAQIAGEQTTLSQAEAKVSAGQAAQSKYASYVSQMRSFTTAVPSDGQVPALIDELQGASSADHVGFQTLSLGGGSAGASSSTAETSTTAPGAFPSQALNLSFTGSYDAVANLLGTLDSFVRADDAHFSASGRLLSIGSVAFAPGSSGGATGSGDVTASVTASDYAVPTALLSGAATPTGSAG